MCLSSKHYNRSVKLSLQCTQAPLFVPGPVRKCLDGFFERVLGRFGVYATFSKRSRHPQSMRLMPNQTNQSELPAPAVELALQGQVQLRRAFVRVISIVFLSCAKPYQEMAFYTWNSSYYPRCEVVDSVGGMSRRTPFHVQFLTVFCQKPHRA